MKIKFIFYLLTIFIVFNILQSNGITNYFIDNSMLLNNKSLLSNNEAKSQWSEKKKMIKNEAKFEEPYEFYKLHKMIRTRTGKSEPEYKFNYRLEELKKIKRRALSKKNFSNSIQNINFIERGPSNVGGRARGIYVDPADPQRNTWFVASVGGGVWKTTDGGTSWEIKTNNMPNLAVSYFGASEANLDVIYVGTGEGFGNIDAIGGAGIFKSTDHGETWSQLSSTANENFKYVNRIVVDPNSENRVIAATTKGVFKSIDGGLTWTNVYSGYVQDLICNPLNFSTLYATLYGLGVIKSLNMGDSWEYSSIGISDDVRRLEIDIAPTDTNRLYISAETSTSSLFISQNAGNTWRKVDDHSQAQFFNINWLGGQGWYDNAIAVHPYNENVVFYGGIDIWRANIQFDSVKGIIKVEENGTKTFLDFVDEKLSFLNGGLGTGEEYWKKDLVEDPDYVDVEIRFGNGLSQKAHMFEKIEEYFEYKNFIDVPFQVWDITNNKQLAVCYYDIEKNNKYDLNAADGDEIFISNLDYNANTPNSNLAKDSGLEYKNIFVVTPKNLSGVAWDPANHPTSNIRILTGFKSVALKKSYPISDGYRQYRRGANIHVDHHELVMVPMDKTNKTFKILNANDGGICVSNDSGKTFNETDRNGFNTAQFYGVDKKPNSSEYFGGTQDNGTWQSKSGVNADKNTPYNYRIGGDGYETSWHYKDPNKLIGCSQFNRFYKSVDGGRTFYASNKGFSGWGNSDVSPFVSKIAKTNCDPDLLFTITRSGVWRTDDFGENWRLIPIANLDGDNRFFSMAQVAISIANPQTVWAGAYLDNSVKPYVSKDGGFTFAPTNGYSALLGPISGIDTHPFNEATAFLTFSVSKAPKILRTKDFGKTWEDITGFDSGNSSSNGFPNVATYCVAVMPFDTNIIWAGTEIGIVESNDNGLSWHLLESNLPAVSVWDIKIVNDEVILATHGRGIWSAVLTELNGFEPNDVVLAPRINGDAIVGLTGVTLNVSFRDLYDSTQVIANGTEKIKTIITNRITDRRLVVKPPKFGKNSFYLRSFKDNKIYRSSEVNVDFFKILSPRKGFASNFSTNSDTAFVLNGMNIKRPYGFSSTALNTPHNYETRKEYLTVLKTPIIISDKDANLTYKDIAIVEPGESGTTYGDKEFWDYVIVEGYKDTAWIPLLNGYDARLNSEWLTAYNTKGNVTKDMLVSHSINLLDHFGAGDTILIRFRLYSDEYTVGWGWLIDDLTIQGQYVGVNDNSSIVNNFTLDQNYPNPFNPNTTINYTIPTTNVKKQSNPVVLKVYDLLGREIKTLVNRIQKPGKYSVNFDGSNLSSGIYYYRLEAADFVQTKKMILLK